MTDIKELMIRNYRGYMIFAIILFIIYGVITFYFENLFLGKWVGMGTITLAIILVIILVYGIIKYRINPF